MDIKVYSIHSIPDENVEKLIEEHESFVLEDIGIENFNESVIAIERMIESKGLKCRVYTKGRAATVALAAIPVSPTVLGGWASAIGIGIHNLSTWNPDYEIAKNQVTGTLTIKYKH